MTDLLVATTNKGKIKEIRAALSGHFKNLRIFTPAELGINIIPEENGKTFLENSVEKSLFYSRISKKLLTIADDSGLLVNALNGLPGVRSARFGGEDIDDEKNIKKLLDEMKGKSDRSAGFVSVITLSLNGNVIRSFRGDVKGVILKGRRGGNGFGYDPIFYYEKLGKTFAQLSAEEKNRISHRALALNKLKDFLITNKDIL